MDQVTENSILNVESIFATLEETIDGYEYRQQQLDFAHFIAQALKQKKVGIFEAGTGTGKSLAALIPAVLTEKKVVVSTATISLQEQYLYKDIPTLQKALPFELSAALVKGRGNYLGLRRFEEYKLEAEMDPRLLSWLNYTETGDRSELDFVAPQEVWQEIASDSDDCMRNRCPHFSRCYYFNARKEAEQADLLVVNHALLLIDAISGGTVLPKYDVLIVDEAHQLPEIATRAFSVGMTVRGVQALCTKALKQVHAPPYLVHNLEEMADDYFYKLSISSAPGKARITKAPEGTLDLLRTVSALKDWLADQDFEQVLDVDNARERLKLKAKALTSIASGYIQCLEIIMAQNADWVSWVECQGNNASRRADLVAAPLRVAPFLQDFIFSREGLESSIWMSATLATGGEDPFAFFKNQVGAPKSVVQARISSPFDYTRQAALYLPTGLPDPNERSYQEAAARCIEEIVHISQGRAFALFTSYNAMNVAYEYLTPRLPFELKKQGEMPRHKLIEWFKEASNPVLLGTSSFWEGVSIDGEQLSCVIIDRIPFQAPDDPVYEARCESMKASGEGSWFNELALPHAIMRLKQGAGRLIRTKSDKGLIAILDPRMTRKYYGKAIISCLPPMKLLKDLSNTEYLDRLFGR